MPSKSVIGLSTRSSVCSLAVVCLLPFAVPAQFSPIPLKPESFNHDLVVEHTAPVPIIPVTTASVATGAANGGFSWFEKGYNADWPATGLPSAGTIVQSEFSMEREYQFAPDYRTNNGVLIDSTFKNAQLSLVSPGPWAVLSFLIGGAHDSSWAPIAYAVHHADSSMETGTIRCKDWLDSTLDYAFTSHGRVNVTNFTFADINANIPKLFGVDVALTNLTSAVTSVELSYVSGAGHSVLMGLSGATDSAGTITPIPFTGYNVDVVVEATATRPQPLPTATTATISSGSANLSWTWYERGYVPGAPESGLPPAGSMVTNALSPNQVYVLAPTFNGKNAALLDAETLAVNLVPASPIPCQALSFLTAAAGGPATNQCVVQYADGSTQTNRLVSPDWLDESTAAVVNAAGRVNINNRILDRVNGSGPRLFAVNLVLSNNLSAFTNVLLECSGSTTSHTAFLAVSGGAGETPPEPATLSLREEANGKIVLESTSPGRLEYTTALQGTNTVWQSAGTITDAVTLTPAQAAEPARFYRVVAP